MLSLIILEMERRNKEGHGKEIENNNSVIDILDYMAEIIPGWRCFCRKET